MSAYIFIFSLAVLGVFAWSLSLVSADAVAMALGMLLGTFGAMLPQVAMAVIANASEVTQCSRY